MRSAYRPAQSIHTPSSSPAGSRPKRPNHASSGAAYNSSTRIYRNWDSEGLTIAWRRSPGNGGSNGVGQFSAQTNRYRHNMPKNATGRLFKAEKKVVNLTGNRTKRGQK